MSLAILVVCAMALAAGILLFPSLPLCAEAKSTPAISLSIIIPARNEEENLPRLLDSLRGYQESIKEIIVIDDASTDRTADVARAHGASVISSQQLPPGWTGKTWACAQGAEHATSETLLFLDADTWFIAGGLNRLMREWQQHQGGRLLALSVLPFHITAAPYEELSLFFNLLMAFGAGGFGAFGKPKLFGQSLLISRELYVRSGGHATVSGRILENFVMSDRIEAAGGRCVCIGGRCTLQIRMFPSGLRQLIESWKKAFADGAAASEPRVLTLAIVWLSALISIVFMPLFTSGQPRIGSLVLYAFAALQIFWFSRRLGTFRWTTALFYPVPLLFFFVLFGNSLFRRMQKRKVTWRGREL